MDLVACEDTRVTGQLLTHLGIKQKLVRCDDHNEAKAASRICAQVEAGLQVALVSDAGPPGISDPGYRVVQAALRQSLNVVPIPGPSAVTAALCASGLPLHAFRFEGYLPVKQGPRRRRLEALAGDSATCILFVPPHKLKRWLADVHSVFGDRDACLARELTKRYENFERARLSELAARYAEKTPRGEMVLLIAGKTT